MPSSWCMALAASVALTTSPSKAGTVPAQRPKVVVAPLEIVGDIGAAWHGDFESRLHDGLRRARAELITADDARCSAEDNACWRTFAAEHDAHTIVDARVSQTERDYVIRLRVISADSGDVLATAEQPCELCGLTEVGSLLEDVAGMVAARIDALASARAVILFQSSPPGAQLRVDGAVLGTTPLNHEVSPGDHVAEATLRGHVSQTRSFTAEAGIDRGLRFDLAPLPRQNVGLRATGWASLGLGLAAAGTGAALVAIDERPITSNCSGENVNAAGVCKFRHDTLAGGITLVALGAAASIAGATIAILTRHNGRERRVTARSGGLAIRF